MARLPAPQHHPRMCAQRVKPNFKSPKPRYFFKEWRKHRRLTQAELAEVVGVSEATISQLENGKQGFTDSTLEALANALACKPGDLLMRNPLDEDAPWSIWDTLDKNQRKQAITIMHAVFDSGKKTGTDG